MKVNVNFVQPFVDGTIETLKVQCSTDSKIGKMHLKEKDVESGEPIEIAGIIGLTSDSFSGSISLCFPKTTFLNLMTRMLGEPVTTINRDIEDGVGELVNIIFGFAKRQLNDGGHTLKKALPSIVRGGQIQTRYLTASPVVILPFETDIGAFHMEIAVQFETLKAA